MCVSEFYFGDPEVHYVWEICPGVMIRSAALPALGTKEVRKRFPRALRPQGTVCLLSTSLSPACRRGSQVSVDRPAGIVWAFSVCRVRSTGGVQSTTGIFPTGKRDKAELGSPLFSPSWASGILDGDKRGCASSLTCFPWQLGIVLWCSTHCFWHLMD